MAALAQPCDGLAAVVPSVLAPWAAVIGPPVVVVHVITVRSDGRV